MGQKYRTEDRKAELMVGKKRGRINHAKWCLKNETS
jgi:hypothetical protein